MNTQKSLLLAATIALTAFVGPIAGANAETKACEVAYTRTACPGQEAISFKKCDGKASCVKSKKAATVEECRAAATKSCRNRRLNITKMKVITAKFNGEAIQTESGKDDFCLEYPKRNEEFNQCTAN